MKACSHLLDTDNIARLRANLPPVPGCGALRPGCSDDALDFAVNRAWCAPAGAEAKRQGQWGFLFAALEPTDGERFIGEEVRRQTQAVCLSDGAKRYGEEVRRQTRVRSLPE